MSALPLHPGERAARERRRLFGLNDTQPVVDLLELVEGQLDVPVLIEQFAADDIAGVLLRHASGDRFVGINADHHPVKQRFTLAHELGHLHLGHQPRIERASDVFGSAPTDPQEVEANYFAAEFLAPRQALTTWLEERDEIATVNAEAIARLALSFGIAFPTACYRLERAGAIGATAKRRLVAELSANGKQYAQRHGDARLKDAMEALWRDKAYPRVPRQTAIYAKQAHVDGLLDDDAYRAIAGDPNKEQDISSWFA